MKIPSPLVSLLPVAVLVVLLFFTIRLLGADALGGGSQICLLGNIAQSAAKVLFVPRQSTVCARIKMFLPSPDIRRV